MQIASLLILLLSGYVILVTFFQLIFSSVFYFFLYIAFALLFVISLIVESMRLYFLCAVLVLYFIVSISDYLKKEKVSDQQEQKSQFIVDSQAPVEIQMLYKSIYKGEYYNAMQIAQNMDECVDKYKGLIMIKHHINTIQELDQLIAKRNKDILSDAYYSVLEPHYPQQEIVKTDKIERKKKRKKERRKVLKVFYIAVALFTTAVIFQIQYAQEAYNQQIQECIVDEINQDLHTCFKDSNVEYKIDVVKDIVSDHRYKDIVGYFVDDKVDELYQHGCQTGEFDPLIKYLHDMKTAYKNICDNSYVYKDEDHTVICQCTGDFLVRSGYRNFYYEHIDGYSHLVVDDELIIYEQDDYSDFYGRNRNANIKIYGYSPVYERQESGYFTIEK